MRLQDSCLLCCCCIFVPKRPLGRRYILSFKKNLIKVTKSKKIQSYLSVTSTATTTATTTTTNEQTSKTLASKSFSASLNWASSDGWIKANVDQIGYYRVNYETENWKSLYNQLLSDHKVSIAVFCL